MVCILFVLLVLSQVCIEAVATNPKSINPSITQTTSETFEVIPDPYLQSEVDLNIHGTSNEFNASQVMTGTARSYVNLTWTHVAGTELTTTASQVPFVTVQDDYPYFWDFCYFTVSFRWEYERMPTDAMFYLTFGVNTTGDFNTTEGQQMFRVGSWLIDSSNDWTALYTPQPPYTTQRHLYSYDLMYFELVAWSGMVQDDSGYQEDPEDTLRVGVGLAPSESFETYNDSHPWQEYNGTVCASISTVSLVVRLDPEEDTFQPDVYMILGPTALVATFIVVYLGLHYYKRKKQP